MPAKQVKREARREAKAEVAAVLDKVMKFFTLLFLKALSFNTQLITQRVNDDPFVLMLISGNRKGTSRKAEKWYVW